MTPGRRADSPRPGLFLLVLFAVATAAQAAAPAARLEALLRELRASGVDVIYSSELVTPEMEVPASDAAPLDRVRQALAGQDLALRQLGPRTYVVIRAARAPAPVTSASAESEPLEEISVYASRYAIDAGLAEPRQLTLSDLERIPGSHDDALRSLQSLPGVVSTGSARPYIRGSLSEDVLVRYDGIPLLDPFHLKNFQSLLSAIDPAAIESIEVFSGGFPVRYGTRSGGVIDITPPARHEGREYRANLSFITAGASTRGRADSLPLEWLAAVRRSTLDMLDPVEDDIGKPQMVDSLGRLRWSTAQGAWTLGWLLLDDRLELGGSDDDESASARYRDEYFWLARDHRFNPALSMRTSLVVTSAARSRQGSLNNPGVAAGELSESRRFDGLELLSDWTFADSARSSYSVGGSLATLRADHRFTRHSQFAPTVAAVFGRGLTEDQAIAVRPQVLTYSLYAANRRHWRHFEAELGLRADGQHHERGGNRLQISPRLNLRYDLDPQWQLYASVGRFTQAQPVQEWRLEEGQQQSDAAQVAVHSIVGLQYRRDSGARLGLEAYSKRWTTAAAYFDRQLDFFSLIPELAPDRVRVQPRLSEASGLELSYQQPWSDRLSSWATLTWSRVADDFPDSRDVLRSWDQPLSLSAGLAWKGAQASLSALAGWHSGWPRTPLATTPLTLGERNTGRWGDYFSLDLRGSWTFFWPSGDLSVVLDITNATNRRNPCCVQLTQAPDASLTLRGDDWLPTLINLGFTYRWGD